MGARSTLSFLFTSYISSARRFCALSASCVLRIASHFVPSLLFPLHAPSLPRVCQFPSFPFTNPPAMARRAAIAAVLASAASLVAAASSKATEPCAVVSNLFQNGEAIPAAVCPPLAPSHLKTLADFLPRRPDSHVYHPFPSMRLPALRLSKTSRSSASSTRPSAISRTPGWATQMSLSIL
jgi:hypothetical protein